MEATWQWIMLSTVQSQNEYLETWSAFALQLAAEHMPECTDQWKIKNTTSHIIQRQYNLLFNG